MKLLFILVCGIPFLLAAGLAFAAARWVDFWCRRSVALSEARQWFVEIICP